MACGWKMKMMEGEGSVWGGLVGLGLLWIPLSLLFACASRKKPDPQQEGQGTGDSATESPDKLTAPLVPGLDLDKTQMDSKINAPSSTPADLKTAEEPPKPRAGSPTKKGSNERRLSANLSPNAGVLKKTSKKKSKSKNSETSNQKKGRGSGSGKGNSNTLKTDSGLKRSMTKVSKNEAPESFTASLTSEEAKKKKEMTHPYAKGDWKGVPVGKALAEDVEKLLEGPEAALGIPLEAWSKEGVSLEEQRARAKRRLVTFFLWLTEENRSTSVTRTDRLP